MNGSVTVVQNLQSQIQANVIASNIQELEKLSNGPYIHSILRGLLLSILETPTGTHGEEQKVKTP